MDDRRDSWTPAGQAERYDPLPSFLRLPVRIWSMLSRRGHVIVAAGALLGLAAVAVAWPYVERDKREGAERRAELASERRTARVLELVGDQHPRRAALSPTGRRRIAAAGGLEAPAAARIAGAELAAAISRDVRARIAAGKLAGPLRRTTCDPVEVRGPRGAGYNCFASTDRARVGGRVLDSGYRFSARADLPATLVWCKENPRPLHPTSYVISVPISPECR